MKRQLHCISNDTHRTSKRNQKRRTLTDRECKNKRSLCSTVHRMRLYYASNITQIKYDQCPGCLTNNDYESMHFLYRCTKCSFFCCNFCMADEYNAGKAIRISASPPDYNHEPLHKPKRSPKISSARKRKAKAQNKGEHNIRVGSKLLMPDYAVDAEANQLGSYELHTVKRIDEGNFAMTEYGEIDVNSNEYYIVNPKHKAFKKGTRERT